MNWYLFLFIHKCLINAVLNDHPAFRCTDSPYAKVKTKVEPGSATLIISKIRWHFTSKLFLCFPYWTSLPPFHSWNCFKFSCYENANPRIWSSIMLIDVYNPSVVCFLDSWGLFEYTNRCESSAEKCFLPYLLHV